MNGWKLQIYLKPYVQVFCFARHAWKFIVGCYSSLYRGRRARTMVLMCTHHAMVSHAPAHTAKLFWFLRRSTIHIKVQNSDTHMPPCPCARRNVPHQSTFVALQCGQVPRMVRWQQEELKKDQAVDRRDRAAGVWYRESNRATPQSLHATHCSHVLRTYQTPTKTRHQRTGSCQTKHFGFADVDSLNVVSIWV